MKKTKKFRDPVYGYIEIDENIVHNIVDTATFQRLRNIRQTSYAPLYPSSLHNRFVHSLGVYHGKDPGNGRPVNPFPEKNNYNSGRIFTIRVTPMEKSKEIHYT